MNLSLRPLLASLLRAMLLCTVFAGSPAHARELERYLLGPADLPAGCARSAELFPLNDKMAKFYEGKVYRSAVPAPVDRHAQSFDCGGQKGTLYFFQYRTVDDQEQALLFARPVLAAPPIVEWRGGFVILSFAQPPDSLQQKLQEKVGTIPAPSTTAAPVESSPTVAALPAVPIPPPAPTPPAPAPTPTPPPPADTPIRPPAPSADAPPPPAPPAEAPPPRALTTPDDISPDVLNKIRKAIDCRDRSLPPELVQVCDWIAGFKKGTTVAPVIASTDTRIGQGYRVDGNGQLGRESFQAAIGTGQIGEIGFVPIFPANGVEELELRTIAGGSSDQRPTPSNDIQRRIANAPRPNGRTFIQTRGESWLARRPDQTLYLRRAGKQWILFALDTDSDGPPDTHSFTITAFQ